MANTVFFIAWDDVGLESIIDISDYIENNSLLSDIRDSGSTEHNHKRGRSPIEFMKLRARYNGQRNYELWLIPVEETITESDLRTVYNTGSAIFKSMIRSKGTQVRY